MYKKLLTSSTSTVVNGQREKHFIPNWLDIERFREMDKYKKEQKYQLHQ